MICFGSHCCCCGCCTRLYLPTIAVFVVFITDLEEYTYPQDPIRLTEVYSGLLFHFSHHDVSFISLSSLSVF